MYCSLFNVFADLWWAYFIVIFALWRIRRFCFEGYFPQFHHASVSNGCSYLNSCGFVVNIFLVHSFYCHSLISKFGSRCSLYRTLCIDDCQYGKANLIKVPYWNIPPIYMYTWSLKKNDTDVANSNSDTRQPISIIFGLLTTFRPYLSINWP